MCTCLVVSHWLKEALKNKQLSYLATARQEGAYRAREVILDHHILYSLCPTLQTHTQIRSPFLPSPASDLSGQFCLPGLWPPVFQLKPRSSLEFSSWIPQPGQQLHVTKEPGSFQRTGKGDAGSKLGERSGRGRKHGSQARKKLGFGYMYQGETHGRRLESRDMLPGGDESQQINKPQQLPPLPAQSPRAQPCSHLLPTEHGPSSLSCQTILPIICSRHFRI